MTAGSVRTATVHTTELAPGSQHHTQDRETGIGSWTREDFFRALREGKRPDGKELKGEFMPWRNLGQLHEDELEALWMYISSVEAKPFGGR